MIKLITIIFLLSGCGAHHDSAQDSELDDGPFPIELINKFIKSAKKISISSDKFEAETIGEAVPKDIPSLELTSVKEKSTELQKTANSAVVKGELFNIKYKISYQYAVKYKNKGHYIQNVKFTPLVVKIDPTITVTAQIASDKPVNKNNNPKAPDAELSFSITWNVKSIFGFQEARSDEFTINGRTGELKKIIRDFE